MINRPSKIVCVGRNYADHAKELDHAIPTQPILFIKPPSSLTDVQRGVVLKPHLGDYHFECELCVRIGQRLCDVNDPQSALAAIDGITLGLDLTRRDLQHALKQQGHPWERAKGFDGACLLADWVEVQKVVTQSSDWSSIRFDFKINDQVRQQGSTGDMLFDIGQLVCEISQTFSLEAGDVIMTGTPAGVGKLAVGDRLTLILHTLTGTRQWDTVCQVDVQP